MWTIDHNYDTVSEENILWSNEFEYNEAAAVEALIVSDLAQ